ncbi:hypothetical protein AWM75_06235 [Aerococcus urinaehominis]|uniref:tetrahydrofolate synthase n=1 Tax=Aerococcus urinaehominis TaxID=128944 RepID=A0A0X8FLM9_9LACT|nr:folylpolyglutamate synthase/dihydrofolate synthase family protein [Aerococcus urinaehominis]AMB99603.1 hypothetical protein AWM75_06235 [Aerococcus urinaehominis]SDL87095.1 dihydrofolate synthase / folylpolyglutamate synthase [Aerococcus urinaehominis]
MKYQALAQLIPSLEHTDMRLGLDNIRQFMASLDNPQDATPTIHVAGTNGKGSTANFMADILQAAGYRVGLYTSPALVEMNERIRVNQENISDQDLTYWANFVQEHLLARGMHLTFFERLTAIAWLYFDSMNVDIIVLEVGLGGRLDATNIIRKPILSMICKIALDHQAVLGDDLLTIAREKAGIIKNGCPVTVYRQSPLVYQEIARIAANHQAHLYTWQAADIQMVEANIQSQRFNFKGESYQLAMAADYQVENACHAILACQCLQKQGWLISPTDIKTALAKSQWPGRYENMSQVAHLPFIIDGSHNEDGLMALERNLASWPRDYPRVAIVGMLADKQNDRALAQMMKQFDVIYTVPVASERSLTSQALASKLQAYLKASSQLIVCQEVGEALKQAMAFQEAHQPSLICAFGSLYLVGQIKDFLGQIA